MLLRHGSFKKMLESTVLLLCSIVSSLTCNTSTAFALQPAHYKALYSCSSIVPFQGGCELMANDVDVVKLVG